MVLNNNLTGSWGTSQNKPLTFTGSYNGVQNDVRWDVNNTYVSAGDDLVIENMEIYVNNARAETTPSSSNTTRKYFL